MSFLPVKAIENVGHGEKHSVVLPVAVLPGFWEGKYHGWVGISWEPPSSLCRTTRPNKTDM